MRVRYAATQMIIVVDRCLFVVIVFPLAGCLFCFDGFIIAVLEADHDCRVALFLPRLFTRVGWNGTEIRTITDCTRFLSGNLGAVHLENERIGSDQGSRVGRTA